MCVRFKTWDKTGDGKFAAEADQILQKLLDDIMWYVRCEQVSSGFSPSAWHEKTGTDAARCFQRTPETGHSVYDGFTALAEKMGEFVPNTGYSKPGEGGLSRMQLYLRDMINDFEQLRAVRDSETPIGYTPCFFSHIPSKITWQLRTQCDPGTFFLPQNLRRDCVIVACQQLSRGSCAFFAAASSCPHPVPTLS